MTQMAVEHDELLFTDALEEFDIACDISRLRGAHDATGYPACKGDPARWVAWRPGCCPNSPRYRLLCDFCKKAYQNWLARQAAIFCPVCMQETGGFVDFTPLRGKA